MKKILVVCLGNICRSPMAEAVFNDLIKQAGIADKLLVESRATSHWEDGKVPHQGTQAKLAEHGINCEGIVSEQVRASDFDEFDLILGMDQQNVKDLKAIAPVGKQDKVKLFLSVLPESEYQEVPDPYYTGDFDLTYKLVKAGANKWLATLI